MIALLVVAALLATTVLTHYEGLRLVSRAVQALRMDPRPRMVVVIFGVMALHVLEIATYAGAYWFGDQVAEIGDFGGRRAVAARDYFYFSAETYTSLGLGDVYPIGDPCNYPYLSTPDQRLGGLPREVGPSVLSPWKASISSNLIGLKHRTKP